MEGCKNKLNYDDYETYNKNINKSINKNMYLM